MNERFAIALNVTNKAPSQYIEMPFDSVVEFNGKLVFFGPDGIYEESGHTDAGTNIVAWFDTPNIDFGTYNQKGIEAFGLGYESSGDVQVTLYGDEDEDHARTWIFTPVKGGQVQQDEFKTLKKYRYGKARYWKVRVGNVDGSDCSFDFLSLAPVIYSRRAR